MKPFNKEEYNRMCAEFMGLIPIPAGTKPMYAINHPEVSEAFLKYDTDWNWIMEVVEKIEEIYYLQPVHILGNQCNILTNKTFKVCRNSKKEAVVQAIWEFLQWYKQQS